MSKKILLAVALSLVILTWMLKRFLNFVPFYLPSYSFWTGILISALSIIGLLLLIHRSPLFSQKPLAALLAIGVVLVVAPIIWPVSLKSSNIPKQKLDDFLPIYQTTEYHEELADVPFEKLDKAIHQVSLADMPVGVLLMKLRLFFSDKKYVPNTKPILTTGPNDMFMVLDDSNPNELVYGMIGKPWDEEIVTGLKHPGEFMAFEEPGFIRVAFNFRLVDKGEQGVLISTETRCLGNDKAAQKILSRYWTVIYPGSSIIRRYWLRKIIDKAQSM